MPADANKALVRRYFDLLNAGDLETVSTLLSPDFRLHFDSVPTLDASGTIGFFGQFLAAFPGIRHKVLEQIAEDDRIATRISVNGTHRGEFMGMPPTGRDIAIGAINIHRVSEGRIVEQWVNSDTLGLMQQLGAIPAPAATSG
jgi:steroid delta-isomerase-like uncharacterized protein